jgi:hypothetical protein
MIMKYSLVAAGALFLMLGASPAPLHAQAAGGGGGGAGGFSKQNLDLPFEAGGNSEDEEEAPEIVVFYGQQYEGDGVFFCCDKSGSMNEGTKFKKLQQEVVKNLTQFSERVQFGIVFFDAQMVKFPTSGQPATASAPLKAAGIAMVLSTTPGHGTCQKPALIACLQYAQLSSAKRKIIIYLSDGFATCPNFNPAQYAQEALNEITQRNTGKVHINTICIGPPGVSNVDEDWMRKLASMNSGSMARIIN